MLASSWSQHTLYSSIYTLSVLKVPHVTHVLVGTCGKRWCGTTIHSTTEGPNYKVLRVSIFMVYNNWWYQSKIALELDILAWSNEPMSQGQNHITFWVWHTNSCDYVASLGLGKPRGDRSPKLGKDQVEKQVVYS